MSPSSSFCHSQMLLLFYYGLSINRMLPLGPHVKDLVPRVVLLGVVELWKERPFSHCRQSLRRALETLTGFFSLFWFRMEAFGFSACSYHAWHTNLTRETILIALPVWGSEHTKL